MTKNMYRFPFASNTQLSILIKIKRLPTIFVNAGTDNVLTFNQLPFRHVHCRANKKESKKKKKVNLSSTKVKL